MLTVSFRISVEAIPEALGTAETSEMGSGDSGSETPGPESYESVQPEMPIRHTISKNISNIYLIFNYTPK